MGVAISKNYDVSNNEYLKKFVGKETIIKNDSFWNCFISFNICPPKNSNEQLLLETKIEDFCQELLKNNLISGNFGILINIFLERSSELLAASNNESTLFTWKLFNILFIIRYFLKFLIETLSEEQLLDQIEFGTTDSRLECLIGTLVGIIVDVPVNNCTYGIQLESVTTLLILLSVHIHSEKKLTNSIIYQLIMKGKHCIHAPLLIRNLLINYISQMKAPEYYGDNIGHSIVLGIASELWSILTFNKSNDIIDCDNYQGAPLANESLLLLLILVHHWTSKQNPYRICLFSCINNADNNPIPPIMTPSLFKIDFNSLYLILCQKAQGDTTTLLLYLLLHQNEHFKFFLLNRDDIERLIIPILKILYDAPNSTSHHIYMSLIIILILSEDDAFNRKIHDIKLKQIIWYTERVLSDCTLGGLLILIVIRTVQYNMLKMRDKYLHTNCLAALANMSAQFQNLHPYVSQRLLSLFETLAKRYQKLIKINLDKSTIITTTTTKILIETNNDIEQDLKVLEEILRMVLEILNSCLTNQLINNPNLVYTLLYNKNAFEPFKTLCPFQDIVHNIEIIIKYFSDILEKKSQQYDVDSNQVLNIIQQSAKYWPKDKIIKFPDLKFKYVEEDQPEDFFIPYVWSLVCQQSILHWTTNDNSQLISIC